MNKHHIFTAHSQTEKIIETNVQPLLMVGFMVYSVFLPLKLGTPWFYGGLPICVLSLVLGHLSIFSFITTPLDELVTKGAYRISRNPAGLSMFLMNVGIGIVCASWVFPLYGAIDMILGNIAVSAEERYLLEKYGDAYREYLNRTPRWIGIPQSKEA